MFLSKDANVEHGTDPIKIYTKVATNDYIFWCLIINDTKIWNTLNAFWGGIWLNIDLKVGVNVGSAIANKKWGWYF